MRRHGLVTSGLIWGAREGEQDQRIKSADSRKVVVYTCGVVSVHLLSVALHGVGSHGDDGCILSDSKKKERNVVWD